jgi:hypothetical protein
LSIDFRHVPSTPASRRGFSFSKSLYPNSQSVCQQFCQHLCCLSCSRFGLTSCATTRISGEGSKAHREVRGNTFPKCFSDTSGPLSLFASSLLNHTGTFQRCPTVTRDGHESLDVVQVGGTIAGLTDSFGVVHLFPLTNSPAEAYIPPLSAQVWFPSRNYRAAECSVLRFTRRPRSPIS